MSARSLIRSTTLVGVFFLPACASYNQPTTWNLESSPEKVRSAQAPTATLERRELASFDGLSLAEAIEELRPDWLRRSAGARVNSEGLELALYVNDVASGDLTRLRTIPSEAAIDVRLLSQPEAWARFGPACRCPAGVILVRMRNE